VTPRERRAALYRTRLDVLAETRVAVAVEYGITVEAMEDRRTRVTPIPEARREVIVRLHARGLSQSEVARLVGCDRSTVHYALSVADTPPQDCDTALSPSI
jgi:DNA-directed RNA polymerase specialized sigma24 family protein